MPRKKPAPPDQTNAENFYYIKQMQARTPMIVVLDTDEEIRGVIEWYDKDCLKIHRTNEPNLLVMKSVIRYMYKQTEAKDSVDSQARGDGHARSDGYARSEGHALRDGNSA